MFDRNDRGLTKKFDGNFRNEVANAHLAGEHNKKDFRLNQSTFKQSIYKRRKLKTADLPRRPTEITPRARFMIDLKSTQRDPGLNICNIHITYPYINITGGPFHHEEHTAQ